MIWDMLRRPGGRCSCAAIQAACQPWRSAPTAGAAAPDGRPQTDKTAKIWDAASGQGLVTFRGHCQWAVTLSVGVQPGREAAGHGSIDGTVKIWDATSGQEVLVLRGHCKSTGL